MPQNQSSKNTFPSIAQSEKAKQVESYYRKWCDAIVTNQFTSSWAVSYNKLAMLYNFYKVGTGSDLTGYLQTAPDGSAMPGIWTSQNSVSTRLKALVGELEHRGYMIKARALNSEAVARKFEERSRLLTERRLQPVIKAAEIPGMPLQNKGEYIPQTDQELDEYMDLTWKDKHVQILESALKWIAHRTHWDQSRSELFEDTLIGNMCVVRNDIVRSVPQSTRVDLLKFIYDPNSSDDNLTDSTYFGEADYMPLAQAAERYGLTMSEMEQCYREYETYLGMGLEARGESDSNQFFGSMPGQSVKWFKNDDGVPRCLVIRACWRDIKVLAHKEESNEKGDFLQDVTLDDHEQTRKRNEGKIIKNKLECWRQGTVIGGKFLREWGECPNQARSLDSLEVSEPPYKVWRQSKSISILEQQVGLQLLKDIALYQLQIQMARAIGKVLVFDEAFLADGMNKDSTMARMKADGIAWINSKEYQISGHTNLFQEYDLSLSASIAQSIQLIEYFDSQLDSISGVGPERQGQVQGASAAVGVTQAALFQSSLITAPLFNGFDRFCSRTQNHLAKLVKMAWGEGDNKKFAPIIGDIGIDFLKEFIDISLDSFDVVVQCQPPLIQDRAKLEQIIMMAVQTGELLPSDALNILLEPDTTVGIRKFTRKVALRQLEVAKQEQAQMQHEQDMQQQQLEQQGQMQNRMLQHQLQLEDMGNQTNLKKTALTGRVKMNTEKIKLLNS